MIKTDKKIIDENGKVRVVYEENGKFYLKSTNKYKETKYTELIFVTKQSNNKNLLSL